MTFRECGVNSLPELITMLVTVGLLSYAVAFVWVVVLDDFYKPGEVPNMAALHTLNLIVGFLYVGLIRESKEEWLRVMRTANDFMLTTHSMVLAAKQSDLRKVLQRIDGLRKELMLFYRSNSSSHGTKIVNMLCCGGQRAAAKKVQRCLSLRERMHSLQVVIPEDNGRLRSLHGRLEGIVSSIETKYFAREPACFKWHLRLLLLAYFGTMPVQLFNAYDRDFTLVVYPIIIYFLFSVAILANVFVNPIEHPELSLCFEALNREIMTDIRPSNVKYLRTLSVY
jgi:hypothetical protein